MTLLSLAACSAPPTEGPTPGTSPQDDASLHGWLVGEEVPTSGAILALPDTDALAASKVQDEPRYRVGISVPVDATIDLGSASPTADAAWVDVADGAIRFREDGFVWSAVVESPGATALRLGFEDLDLPEGVELYLYTDRGQVDGPYTGTGRPGPHTFFARTLPTDTVHLQLRYDGVDIAATLDGIDFTLSKVGHLDQRFYLGSTWTALPGERSFCAVWNAECVENAECNVQDLADDWIVEAMRAAIADLLFESGSDWYLCTGGLIESLVAPPGYLLTANHCISTESEAASLESYFFHTAPCGTTDCVYADDQAANSITPSFFGAEIVDTNGQTDFSLLHLNGVLPQGVAPLPFSTIPVANTNGAELHRISHPAGAPQAYSGHVVDAEYSLCGDPGEFMYSIDVIGATEGGSSGSPVVNSNGQIVGQLYGACGENLIDNCDAVNNRTYDGAFAASWAISPLMRNALAGEPLPVVVVLETHDVPNLKAGKTWRTQFTNDGSYDNLTFETFGNNGDADLYVKLGAEPTTDDYDCRSWSASSNEICTINPADVGTFHVMVYAYSKFRNLTLEIATFESDCDDTDGDGVCDSVDACPGYDDTLDDDDDGLPDDCDGCPNDSDNDIDSDGVCGDVDDCPTVYGEGADGCPIGDIEPPVISHRSHDLSKKLIWVHFETDEPATGLVCMKSSCASTPLGTIPLGTIHDTDWFSLRGKTYTIEVTDGYGNSATYGPYKK
ncbi:MAG: trypsin-like peptidase domain-containing protein [Deltaproteobacteria bacterium]|nr:trypsin-like peptidase domain-containing protein [Deltaproteobacteria bacterium]